MAMSNLDKLDGLHYAAASLSDASRQLIEAIENRKSGAIKDMVRYMDRAIDNYLKEKK